MTSHWAPIFRHRLQFSPTSLTQPELFNFNGTSVVDHLQHTVDIDRTLTGR
ncbi:MAG: hypothetical protein AAGE59_30390 [Cyanobacteria bacterium P01_F01_bin.86]